LYLLPEGAKFSVVCLSQEGKKNECKIYFVETFCCLFSISMLSMNKFQCVHSPKGTAGVNHPMPGSFLSYPFFHESLFATEEFHSQPVVGWLEPCLKLVLEKV
jgi:hypothetical protein